MEDNIPKNLPKDPVPEAAAPQEEAPKKKRRKWPLVLLIILIILGAGGYYVYQNLPSTQAEKHVKAAQEYYNAKDLDKAVTELVAAKELMPEKAADYNSVIAGYYNTSLESLISEKKYEDAIKLVEKEKDILPDRKAQFNDTIASYYALMADEALQSEDQQRMADMIQLISALPQEYKSDVLNDIRNKLDVAVNEYKLTSSFKEFADKLAGQIEAGEWDAIYSDIRSDLFTAFGSYRNIITTVAANSKYLPLISEPDSKGNRLGLYHVDGLYYFYYGSYENEKRSGNGTWITVVNKLSDDTYRNYRCESEWANDEPNGEFTEYETTKLEGSDEILDRVVSGTTDLGLYSGKVSFRYGDTPEMYGTFTNGHPTVIMNEDPNGESAFVIAISDDQRYWVTNSEGANGIHGIRGFK